MRAIEISKSKLAVLYGKRQLSTFEIARHLKCCPATVWKRLHQFGIPLRPPGVFAVDLPKERLEVLYLRRGYSTWEIEKRFGYTRSRVYRKLHEYGIPVRNIAEAHIQYARKNFSGSKPEQAYLIGFAMGDLRVRKTSPRSETIHVDCGSTQGAQILLITQLFKPYGRVWVGKPNKRGARQIECFLNDSFGFLLSPRQLADRWITARKEYFAAFLAGFTDAEGCISINGDGQAYYSLGNYNRLLLQQIRGVLIRFGIPMRKLCESKIKGRVTFGVYRHNRNYWSLRIGRKRNLLKLFALLGPFLKHADKIKALTRARRNIAMRNRTYGYLRMQP